jgi:hypothetical protein
MVNKLLIFLFSVSLFACSPSKNVKENPTKQLKVKKKGRKLYGKIVVYSVKSKDEVKETGFPEDNLDLYFKIDEEYYLINVSKGDISSTELGKQMNKELKIRGEIIELANDGEASKSSTKSTGKVQKKGMAGHIIIYEIIE